MIRVDNLVKRFGDLTAVDNISFDVDRGEIFAFLGPNGAGKTTTIKMLRTLHPLTYGVDGVRTVLTGVTHFGIALDGAVLVGVAILLLSAGAWRFSKIEI